MRDRTYRRVLDDARLLAPGGDATGVTVWRERGLATIDLLLDRYLVALAGCGRPMLARHDFLLPEAAYRAVFPDYRNVYTVLLPGPDGTARPFVLQPDNMASNVELLRRHAHNGPLVAVGGLLRSCPPPVLPLFRERYIWPAVQVTQLVEAAAATALLDRHQRALESLFDTVGLPVVSVRVPPPAGYGDVCYLTVSCLPDGRPTVLSTSYLIARRYRAALGETAQLIDIGFTGKVLALVAMHHRDQHGLALPSHLAPTQVGVNAAPGQRPDRLVAALTAAGLRVGTADPDHASSDRRTVGTDHDDTAGTDHRTVDTVHRRRRRHRRLLRLGHPLVLDLSPGSWWLTSRSPVTRSALAAGGGPEPSSGGPGPSGGDSGRVAAITERVRAALLAHDARLAGHAAHRFERTMHQGDLLQQLCADCHRRHRPAVYGWVTPDRPGACRRCGRAGSLALVSDDGRFY